jgi:hypothetical protein
LSSRCPLYVGVDVLDEPLDFTGDGSARLEHAPACLQAIETQTS